MKSLYEKLEVPTNSSSAFILSKFKALSYRYKKEHREDDLCELNSAYKLLSDPYQRAFYDKFGDQYLSVLSNPLERFIYPRIFTTLNIFACWLFLTSFLLNCTCWFFMNRYFQTYTLANFLYIASMVCPLFLLGNIVYTCWAHISSLSGIIYCIVQAAQFSVQVLIISLSLDGHLSLSPALGLAISIELAFLVYLLVRSKNEVVPVGEKCFYALKSIVVLLYVIPKFPFKLYLPITISLLFSSFVCFTYFIPEGILLFYCGSIDILSRRSGWILPLFIYVPGIMLSLLVCVYLALSYKNIPSPRSFRVSSSLGLPAGERHACMDDLNI